MTILVPLTSTPVNLVTVHSLTVGAQYELTAPLNLPLAMFEGGTTAPNPRSGTPIRPGASRFITPAQDVPIWAWSPQADAAVGTINPAS